MKAQDDVLCDSLPGRHTAMRTAAAFQQSPYWPRMDILASPRRAECSVVDRSASADKRGYGSARTRHDSAGTPSRDG